MDYAKLSTYLSGIETSEKHLLFRFWWRVKRVKYFQQKRYREMIESREEQEQKRCVRMFNSVNFFMVSSSIYSICKMAETAIFWGVFIQIFEWHLIMDFKKLYTSDFFWESLICFHSFPSIKIRSPAEDKMRPYLPDTLKKVSKKLSKCHIFSNFNITRVRNG